MTTDLEPLDLEQENARLRGELFQSEDQLSHVLERFGGRWPMWAILSVCAFAFLAGFALDEFLVGLVGLTR